MLLNKKCLSFYVGGRYYLLSGMNNECEIGTSYYAKHCELKPLIQPIHSFYKSKKLSYLTATFSNIVAYHSKTQLRKNVFITGYQVLPLLFNAKSGFYEQIHKIKINVTYNLYT